MTFPQPTWRALRSSIHGAPDTYLLRLIYNTRQRQLDSVIIILLQSVSARAPTREESERRGKDGGGREGGEKNEGHGVPVARQSE